MKIFKAYQLVLLFSLSISGCVDIALNEDTIKFNSEIALCDKQLPNTTFGAWADCYDRSLSWYTSKWPPLYPDHVNLLTAIRRNLAEKVDGGQMSRSDGEVEYWKATQELMDSQRNMRKSSNPVIINSNRMNCSTFHNGFYSNTNCF